MLTIVKVDRLVVAEVACAEEMKCNPDAIDYFGGRVWIWKSFLSMENQ